MKVNPVARFTFWFLFLLVVSFTVLAQELGKPMAMGVSICLTKEDAVAIFEVEKKDGQEASSKAFAENPQCANVPIEFTPRRIVTTIRTGRGLGQVVEIKSGDKVAYWLTYRKIKGIHST